MGFVREGSRDWEREDPVNAGVISDKLVTTLTGRVRLRWIVLRRPEGR